MSLVIDANTDGGYVKQANQEIDTPSYPDFSQLLLKPDVPNTSTTTNDGLQGFVMTAGDVFPSAVSVKTINGTVINFWSSDIILPICYQGDCNGGGYGGVGKFISGPLSNGQNFSTEAKYRVGINHPLPAGKIIGKEIICMPYFGYVGSNYGNVMNFGIRVGLLHTDGTITYCGPEMTSADYTSRTAGVVKQELFSQQNTGVVSLEGDYVIAEIRCNFAISQRYIDFGRDGGPQVSSPNSQTPHPIQISIE